jgi:N-acetylglucosaminyldiphosphoundecaprenol N-acetyl-beta-D-mannosaminyltransferase
VSNAPRLGIIGSRISACDTRKALELLNARLKEGGGGYVCFTNVHAAVTGRLDPAFRAVTNNSFLSLADGKPVYWAARVKGCTSIGHVPGPDFMLHALTRFRDRRHFFYGSQPQVLERLVAALQARVPGLTVCGTLSPPFRPLSEAENADHRRVIREAGADFVWVGLGAPKQELWMAQASPHLPNTILFGVGAAFDFHAGTLRRAPGVLRRLGLEWLFRLSQEPRRLAKRYIVTNTLYLYYLAADAFAGGEKQ